MHCVVPQVETATDEETKGGSNDDGARGGRGTTGNSRTDMDTDTRGAAGGSSEQSVRAPVDDDGFDPWGGSDESSISGLSGVETDDAGENMGDNASDSRSDISL